MFAGLSPWFALIILDYFHAGHLLEVLLANLGIIVITTLLLSKSIKQMRQEHRDKQAMLNQHFSTARFEENSQLYKLTKREIEIALLLRQGWSYQVIGDKLFISRKTVNNHIQNLYDKVGVSNKFQLFNKLF